MQRPIKFRAWDNWDRVMVRDWLKTWKDDECDPDNDYDFKKLELLISNDGHVLENTYEHGICDMHYLLQGKPKYTLMQYTGLHDKNGVEIYEGDIYKITLGRHYWIYEVKAIGGQFGNTLFGILICDNVTTRGDSYTYTFMETRDFVHGGKDCEVIGNIYENLQLLEVK